MGDAVRELDQRLHDARLVLASFWRDRDKIQIEGSVDRPTQDSPVPLLGRFPLVVRIHGVDDLSVEDDEGVGELIVESVSYDDRSSELVFESAIPGRLRVRTASPAVDVEIGEQPIATRRWGRWRQSGPGPS